VSRLAEDFECGLKLVSISRSPNKLLWSFCAAGKKRLTETRLNHNRIPPERTSVICDVWTLTLRTLGEDKAVSMILPSKYLSPVVFTYVKQSTRCS
jgi:hypothetical protein